MSKNLWQILYDIHDFQFKCVEIVLLIDNIKVLWGKNDK